MRLLLALCALAGCSGASNTVIDNAPAPTPTPDGGSPASDGASSTPPNIYGQCGAPKALSAGTYTEPRANVTMRWPAPWTGQQNASNSFATLEPYMYLPTGATAEKQASAEVTLYDDEVATDEADAAKRLRDATNGVPAGQVRRLTIGNYPAVMWWTQEPPPQPGCFQCPGDPGPDLVTISLSIDVHLRIVQLRGSARVNAPADVFCDIEAIELGVSIP